MAIQGLTCRESRQVGALPVLGKFFKGAPKSGGRPGKDLNYFRLATSDGQLSALIETLYGLQPGDSYSNGIRFYFPASEFEKCMPTTMAAFKGGSCYVMCDRDRVQGERTAEGQWIRHRSDKPACRYPKCLNGKKGWEACQPSGKLRIIIPELQRFGIVEVGLGALNDLEHVSKQLEEIQSRIAAHGGDLSTVPLKLYRKNRSVSTPKAPGSSERVRREFSFVEVAIDTEYMKRSLGATERMALASAGTFGDRAEPRAISAGLDTTHFEDEFGARPDLSFRVNDTWKDVQMSFDKSRSFDEVSAASAAARSLIGEGNLPEAARNQINIASSAANDRIALSDQQPIEAEIVEEAIVNPQRIQWVYQAAGLTKEKAVEKAQQLELDPDQLLQWSEGDFQRFRNNLFAFSRHVAKKFDSPDDAIAAFKKFGNTDEYKRCTPTDDQAVWEAWKTFVKE